jgi:hypothetical protein
MRRAGDFFDFTGILRIPASVGPTSVQTRKQAADRFDRDIISENGPEQERPLRSSQGGGFSVGRALIQFSMAGTSFGRKLIRLTIAGTRGARGTGFQR